MERDRPLFRKVLVANRGAIAARVIHCLRKLDIPSVAVFSSADTEAPYLAEATERIEIGPASPADSYLNQEKLVAAALRCGADAIHPGYGFLSENPDFARRLESEGIAFIGPAAKWIEAMGHKTNARNLMQSMGLPVASGSAVLDNDPQAVSRAAASIGYPVLVKPAAGGGGIGMIAVHGESELLAAVERSRVLAQRSFADSDIYLEKLIDRPRHIEFQVLADRYGEVRHAFERDCSVQRRHQKVIEEAPAPGVPRSAIAEIAGKVCEALGKLGYDNIGTVEMLMGSDGSFHFLEMNTRIQVEHAVTEMALGIDLVEAQIRLAAGCRMKDVLPSSLEMRKHAVEVRVYAEDPRTFFPSPGRIKSFKLPSPLPTLRVETGYSEGNTITPHYDPLLAKIIGSGETRSTAIESVARALSQTHIEGVKTNIPFLLNALSHDAFLNGLYDTGFVSRLDKERR